LARMKTSRRLSTLLVGAFLEVVDRELTQEVH
jgi:hypothetical protein